jgi:hypothetical protein
MVSREYSDANTIGYWFGFHPYQEEALSRYQEGFVALGCGSEKTILFVPKRDFVSWVDGMHVTQTRDRSYRHVRVSYDQGRYFLTRRKGMERVDLTSYLL